MPRETVAEFWQSSRDQRWYFHRKSANGQITQASQGYASSQGCRRAAKRDLPGLKLVRTHP